MDAYAGHWPTHWLGSDHPPAWDEVVTCNICGHTSRARWQRSTYTGWICLNRRACSKRQNKRNRRRYAAR